MVDTFSQYGPGLVSIAVCALLVGPRTLERYKSPLNSQISLLRHLAGLPIQNDAVEGDRLFTRLCCYHSPLACWDHGNGNINVAPSVLGLRHLPTLCMVLAISCLRPPARLSIFTGLCTALAGLWSVECLIGTLGIHLSSIAMINLRARAYGRLVTDAALAASPLLLSIAALMIATLLRSGSMPDYQTYLDFLAVYNPTSNFWSHAADFQNSWPG